MAAYRSALKFGKILGFICMVALFLWQSIESYTKYNSFQTAFKETVEDTGLIQYPSISFCPDPMWTNRSTLLEVIARKKNIFVVIGKNVVYQL